MIFTNKQLKEANKKLSPGVQSFIVENETTELISRLLEEAILTEEQSDSADSEILYAMLGLQSLTTAIENIAKLTNKNSNDFSKLKSELENKIFSKIKSLSTAEAPTKDNFVGVMEENKMKANVVRKTKSGEEIKNKLNILSPALQTYINGGVWKQSVSKIGTQLNLKAEQMPKLENEVFLVLISLEPPSDFVENIKREVGVDEATAKVISNYINGTVFGMVMKDIKQAWAPANSSQNSARPTEQDPQSFGLVVSSQEEEWSKPNLENMAKAMGVDMPPANLPVGDGPRVVHNYNAKADPYREIPE